MYEYAPLKWFDNDRLELFSRKKTSVFRSVAFGCCSTIPEPVSYIVQFPPAVASIRNTMPSIIMVKLLCNAHKRQYCCMRAVLDKCAMIIPIGHAHLTPTW